MMHGKGKFTWNKKEKNTIITYIGNYKNNFKHGNG